MKKGDKKMIYQDPITEKKPEGLATLKRKIMDNGIWEGRPMERWLVHFEDDGPREFFERNILGEA